VIGQGDNSALFNAGRYLKAVPKVSVDKTLLHLSGVIPGIIEALGDI
jgi:hypothetical protein